MGCQKHLGFLRIPWDPLRFPGVPQRAPGPLSNLPWGPFESALGPFECALAPFEPAAAPKQIPRGPRAPPCGAPGIQWIPGGATRGARGCSLSPQGAARGRPEAAPWGSKQNAWDTFVFFSMWLYKPHSDNFGFPFTKSAICKATLRRKQTKTQWNAHLIMPC